MEVKIEKYESATALLEDDAYNRGQPRPILLRIDWEDEEITVRVDYEHNSTPSRVWHGIASEYTLTSCLDATELREWVQSEIAPLAEQAIQYYGTKWDGSNNRGNWQRGEGGDSPADPILEEIERLCGDDREVPQLHGDSPGLWDVREWANVTKEELNAETTDEQIEKLATEIEAIAEGDNVVLCGPDLREWLTGKRDEMRDSE